MATSQSNNLLEEINQSDLECTICSQQLKQSKTLSCLHSFCFKCLAGWVKSSKDDKLECPTCGMIGPLPDGGIKELPPNTFIESILEMTKKCDKPEKVKCFCKRKEYATNYCKNCRQYLCGSCSDYHTELPLTSKHKQISVEERQLMSYTEIALLHSPLCLLHNEPLKFYCIDCKRPICVNCTIIEHKEHKLKSISDAFKILKVTSATLQEAVQKCENTIQKAIKNINDNAKILEQNKETSLRDIDNHVDEMIKYMNEKREKKKNEVETIYQRKMNASEVQINELITTISDINIQMSNINLLLMGNEATAMESSDKEITALKDRMEKLPKTEPDDNGQIHFIKNKHTDLLQNVDIGHFRELRAADYLTLQGDQCVTQCQTIVVKIIKTDECKIDVNELNVTWTQPSGQTDITQVYDENGDYVVTGKCISPGVCKLDVSIDGEPIKKSPMIIKVEKEGLVNTIQINKDVRDAVKCEDDCLLVSCLTNEIYKYKPTGEYIDKITLPEGVKVNRMFIMKNGNIAFSDDGYKCIKVCNMNGDVIKSIGEGVLEDPAGIHVDEASNVVYVADCSGCVFMIDIDNDKIIKKIGLPGKQEGQLSYVIDVTLTKQGHVLILEFNTQRLQLFDEERFFNILVPLGDENSKVMYPRGVVFDGDDNIIISSYNKLQLFSSNGNFIKRIDKEQDGINNPHGLCIISHYPRSVAVVNTFNKNVKLYNY